jgi:hypothetical protein
MSEPDSLYLRVRLSKGAFERYLASQAADARDFDDWTTWLGRARMHGAVFTREKIAEIARGVRKRSMAEEIAGWTNDAWAFARSHYDELTETWRFGIANFSENYQEFLEYLPPLRAVDRFKDLPGTDFMLVYDHFWNAHRYTVLLEFANGASRIVGSPGQGAPFPERLAEEARGFVGSFAADVDAGLVSRS